MLKFDDRLSTEKNYDIFSSIDNDKMLLRENGGKFTTDDLEGYLGVYNQIADAWHRKILDDEIISSNFSYQMLATYDNQEIRGYLAKIREDDDTYFLGLDQLAKHFR